MKTERKRSTVLGLNPGDFFVSSFGVIGSFLLLGWIISGIGSRSETSDKITYLFGCLAALVFGIYSLRKRLIPATVGLFAAAAWLLTLTGIAVIEHREMSKEHPMGFGLGVLVFTIAFFLFLNWYFKSENSKKRVNYFLWIPAIFVIVSVALAYWQTSTTLLESGHSEYVINEIWGPAAGYNTYQEFIPQYVYLIGWLVKPILFNLGAEAGTAFLVLLLTGFGYLSVLLMIWLSRKSWPSLSLPLLILAVLPFSTPTPGWNRISFIGPASTLLSGPALRVLGGILVGLSIVVVLSKLPFKAINSSWLLSIPGFVSAVVFWNNLDFGLAAIAASIVLVITYSISSKPSALKSISAFVLGHLFGHSFVLAFLSVNQGIPNWSYFGWFARQFGGGFGGVTIEMPGPVLVSVPLMMATAALGVYVMLKWNSFEESNRTKENYRAAVTSAYFGTFCTFALPYYVNRSYHAGQMSILYITLAIAIISALGLIHRMVKKSNKFNLATLFPNLVLAFMMATIFLIPNPGIEWDRITGGNSNGTFPRPPLVKAIDQIPAAKIYAESQNKTIGFFGEGGNYVHALNGIPSANIYNSPLDMFQSDAALQLSCKILRERNFDILVLTESAEYTFAWDDKSLCEGLYYIEEIPGVGKIGIKKT